MGPWMYTGISPRLQTASSPPRGSRPQMWSPTKNHGLAICEHRTPSPARDAWLHVVAVVAVPQPRWHPAPCPRPGSASLAQSESVTVPTLMSTVELGTRKPRFSREQ